MRQKTFSNSPVAGEAVSCLPANVRGRVGRSARWLASRVEQFAHNVGGGGTPSIEKAFRPPPHQGAETFWRPREAAISPFSSFMPLILEKILVTRPCCGVPPAGTKAVRHGRPAPPPTVQQPLLVVAALKGRHPTIAIGVTDNHIVASRQRPDDALPVQPSLHSPQRCRGAAPAALLPCLPPLQGWRSMPA